MKSYKELADKVFERRDKYLVARKKKRKKTAKRVSATACALAVLLGISAWHLDWFNPDAQDKTTVYSQTNPQFAASNTYTVIEIPLFPATQPTTEVTTTNNTTEQTAGTTKEHADTSTTTQNITKYYQYSLSSAYSDIVDYAVEGDIIKLLLKSPDTYMEINSNTGEITRQVYLPNTPGEMQFIGDELWISYPQENKIVVYNTSSMMTVKQEYFLEFLAEEMEAVRSFDVYGDYIIVAEDLYVYRYNMKTKEVLRLNQKTNQSFSDADIVTDKNAGLVYIGESGYTGAKLFCVDIQTFEIKSTYVHPINNGGLDNYIRKVYVRDDGVYWGGLKFALGDVSKLLKTYETKEYNGYGTHYVDDRFVVTCEGFFDRLTGEVLWKKTMSASYSVALVTESGNVLYTEFKKIIIATNRLAKAFKPESALKG